MLVTSCNSLLSPVDRFVLRSSRRSSQLTLTPEERPPKLNVDWRREGQKRALLFTRSRLVDTITIKVELWVTRPGTPNPCHAGNLLEDYDVRCLEYSDCALPMMAPPHLLHWQYLDASHLSPMPPNPKITASQKGQKISRMQSSSASENHWGCVCRDDRYSTSVRSANE
jgi:hypothetical protein